ncbi:hypothetical protein [Enterococcus cecorum]|uniref:Uncharacterized protein n=1 Tax=Enterococcus cecorum DSM 20682 = ATCC 43198 TaxID=1121864 RepID=S1RR27_9ENTE|nr:hypothetical protein [Enterococcus cecorum]EOX18977.1 hypothetical protein I567_00731 [Enterococcus cecorum DSM 20682 = ATCC 43198]ESK61293.1 hypothetical protein OMO_01353 [Enterococcus cecorum DSM 20682 = ATCC 43198]CAI3429082.1 hypothetical protein CIRMBP1318_01203 [Enterococcus cecorum DSM 20682 = ATCC 43198]SQE56735.1 Uncharacterised protein [Enterococcus cecorum]
MKKYSSGHGTVKLIVSDNVAIIDIFKRGISGNIAFDRHLLDMYAEDYIKEHFEMSEKDGWIRRLESDES